MPDATRKPTILVLASTYPRWHGDHEPGFVHELSQRLSDSFDVTVLCPHARGALSEENLDGVHVVRFRYAPARWETLVNDGGIVGNLRGHAWKWLLLPGFLISMAWRTQRLLRRAQFDVVHAHWLLPQGLIVALPGLRRGNRPQFLVTSHGGDLFGFRAAPFRWLKLFVVRRAAAVTVVSEAMRAELVRIGADATKISVLPMGVDLKSLFVPDPGVERSRNEILFVGRLVEKKGLRVLIDAMPMILASHPSAQLTIVGFGPEEDERRKQVDCLGLGDKVSFIGAVSQQRLPQFFRRAAVFVAPFVQAASGDQEGLGLVSVEAAGCGCPVITSDLPATRDVYRDAPCARLVPPGSVNALGDAVCSVLSAGPQERTATSRLRATLVAHFNWASIAERYTEILSSLRRI